MSLAMSSFASGSLRPQYLAPYSPANTRKRMLGYSVKPKVIDSLTPLLEGRRFALPTGALAGGSAVLRLSCQQGPQSAGVQSLLLRIALGPQEGDTYQTLISFGLPEASTATYYSIDLQLQPSPIMDENGEDAAFGSTILVQGTCQAQCLLAATGAFVTLAGQIQEPIYTLTTPLAALPSIGLGAQLAGGVVSLALLEWEA